jgi:hypothetical protein
MTANTTLYEAAYPGLYDTALLGEHSRHTMQLNAKPLCWSY